MVARTLVCLLLTGCSLSAQLATEPERIGREYDQHQRVFIREALRIASLPKGIEQALLRVVERTARLPEREMFRRPPLYDDEHLSAVREVLKVSRDLPPDRRAAALLAVDLVTERVLASGADRSRIAPGSRDSLGRHPKTPGEAATEKMGARFAYSELGGGWVYQRNWLWESRKLNPHGRAGALAFLELARNGFDTSGDCAGGGEQFRKVIARMQPFVQQSKWPDVTAEAQFLLGDAYRDIVALAGGADADYVDGSQYKTESGDARIQAIVHYQAGLALDRESLTASLAQEKLAGLQSGETPKITRFYCVYD